MRLYPIEWAQTELSILGITDFVRQGRIIATCLEESQTTTLSFEQAFNNALLYLRTGSENYAGYKKDFTPVYNLAELVKDFEYYQDKSLRTKEQKERLLEIEKFKRIAECLTKLT